MPIKPIKSKIDAHLFVLDDGFVYATSAVSNLETTRHAGVLLISLDDTPIQVHLAQSASYTQYTIQGHAIILAPSVKRSITVGEGGAMSIHFDPAHPIFFAMAKNLASQGAKLIDKDCFKSIRQELMKCRSNADGTIVKKVFNKCTRVVENACSIKYQRDPRIVGLLDELITMSPLDHDFDKILKSFSLSASRFSHLFTDNAGLSLRSFLQWRKIKEALKLFPTGQNMTEIAHASGFSDSAHFCRTFNNCLGLKPSMFGDGRSVDVHVVVKLPNVST